MNIKTIWALGAAVALYSCVVTRVPSPEVMSQAIAQAETLNAQENNLGIGAYAALNPKWPCDSMMRVFKHAESLKLSILWNTFGNNLQCLKQWAKDPRPKLLQTHLINEVCQRNNRCGKYELLHGMTVSEYVKRLKSKDSILINKIKDNVNPIANFYAQHPQIECRVSAGLESNIDVQSYKWLVSELKPIFPEKCKWVWNPVHNNSFNNKPINGLIFEAHGDSPNNVDPPCIVNLDGVDIELNSRKPAILSQNIEAAALPRFIASFASCEASYLWIAEFNGIGRGGFVDPRKRNNWPSSKVFDELAKYFIQTAPAVTLKPWDSNDDAAKKGCKTFIKTKDGDKKGFLFKQSEPPVAGRGAVVFLPSTYSKKNYKLSQVFIKKGRKKIATAYEYKIYTEDNSNRPFWRFRKLAKDIPYNVVLHFGKVCAVIENPKIRND